MAFNYTKWLVYAEMHHPDKLPPKSTAIIDHVITNWRKIVPMFTLMEHIRGPAPKSWGGYSS